MGLHPRHNTQRHIHEEAAKLSLTRVTFFFYQNLLKLHRNVNHHLNRFGYHGALHYLPFL